MCSISPYGQTGPLAASPGDDTTAQALSALSQLTGNEDGSPVVMGQRYAEGVGAVYALGAADGGAVLSRPHRAWASTSTWRFMKACCTCRTPR